MVQNPPYLPYRWLQQVCRVVINDHLLIAIGNSTVYLILSPQLYANLQQDCKLGKANTKGLLGLMEIISAYKEYERDTEGVNAGTAVTTSATHPLKAKEYFFLTMSGKRIRSRKAVPAHCSAKPAAMIMSELARLSLSIEMSLLDMLYMHGVERRNDIRGRPL